MSASSERWPSQSVNDRFAPRLRYRSSIFVPKSTPTRKSNSDEQGSSSGLVARLGIFDATMLVMGGIVGSGIFINPYVVASVVHTPSLILGAWIAGGAIALIGAFIYAELAGRMPKVGGQYAYLRDAYHPALGFLYGWASLFVINGGATAVVAVTFAKYFREISGAEMSEKFIAIAVVLLLVVINCLGVKAGSGVQSAFMILRILAIAMIVFFGAWFILKSPAAPHPSWRPLLDRPISFELLTLFGAAMIPVLFSYGGWQTSNYVASEIRDPRRNLPRALLFGVLGIIALYVSVNFIYVEALAPAGLASTPTPATDVMRRALGGLGGTLIAVAIASSTLGFLSQAMLTHPRVYFAMADDGLSPRQLAWLWPRSHAPVAAIVLESVITIAGIFLGTYEQILSYVVVMDWLFFGLTASCLFVFRAREKAAIAAGAPAEHAGYRVPGHPYTTGLFVSVAGLITFNTIYKYPRNAGAAVCILLAGVPVFFLFRRHAAFGKVRQ